MSDVEDPIDMGSDGGGDLFGDDDGLENDGASEIERVDSEDRELASDRDADDDDDIEARSRRYASEDQRQEETKEQIVMEMNLYRHTLPNPEDGEVCHIPKATPALFVL